MLVKVDGVSEVVYEVMRRIVVCIGWTFGSARYCFRGKSARTVGIALRLCYICAGAGAGRALTGDRILADTVKGQERRYLSIDYTITMRKTKIFISSTCYDLSQIRQDLKDGIRSIGHEPILSESRDFPVNPALSSVENCIEAVKNEADIFVLIMGNQYGCQLESGRSITNTELLTAIEKGIPIYTFTLKKMVNILPVWKKNPNGDYSNIVDNNKVFEFIDEVRNKRALWNFEFDSAQDILEILKAQLSFLLNASLEKTKSLNGINESLLSKVSGKAIEYLVNKPKNYEILFFFQVLTDEINRYKYIKKDCEHSVVLKAGQTLSDVKHAADWQVDKLNQLVTFVESLNNIFSAFSRYYGDPGVPSDLDGLYYVAHRMGSFYASILEWIIDVKSVRIHDALSEVNKVLAEVPTEVVMELEGFAPHSIQRIEEALEKERRGELQTGDVVNLEMHLSIPDDVMRRFNEEFRKATKKIAGS